MTTKLKYFFLENEQIIKLKVDKTKDRVSIFINDKQKVYFPDLIQYIKNNNDDTTISFRLCNLLLKVQSLKKVSDDLMKEANKDPETFFDRYCSKMKFKYTNENIISNKQTYTEEELFISRFIEQSGMKRYSSFHLDKTLNFCTLYFVGHLYISLLSYNRIITTLYNILKILYDCCLDRNKKKLSLFEMKIIKFFFLFKSFFYLTELHTNYSIQDNEINRSPRQMKKRVDTAIANASKMLDIYFLRNVQTDNIKYKSFFNSFNNLSFDDRIGNTDYLEKFDESLEMMCQEEVILPEMMKLYSFQYILPMYMSNDLVNMIRAYGFFMLNYRTPLVNDDHSRAKVKDVQGNISEYYRCHLDCAAFACDNLESVFITKNKNKNICYFDSDMISLEYIEFVIDACLDISQNYDIFDTGSGYELSELLKHLNIKTETLEILELNDVIRKKNGLMSELEIKNYLNLLGLDLSDKIRSKIINKYEK